MLVRLYPGYCRILDPKISYGHVNFTQGLLVINVVLLCTTRHEVRVRLEQYRPLCLPKQIALIPQSFTSTC